MDATFADAVAFISPPPGAALFAVADSARVSSSFGAFDDALCAADACGLIAVRVSTPAEVRAISAHVERRATGTERRVVRAPHADTDSALQDLARQLGVACVPNNPAEAARAIADAADLAVVIVPLLADNAWDLEAARALGDLAPRALIVVVSLRSIPAQFDAASSFEIASQLSDAELLRWWAVVADRQRTERPALLAELEAWTEAALAAEPQDASYGLGEPALRLFGRLRLARRAWPAGAIGALGDELSLATLRAAGLVESRDGFLAALAVAGAPSVACTDEDRQVVAAALVRTFADDAGAHARAGALLADCDALPAAEAALRRSLELADDGAARALIWGRFRLLIEGRPEDERGAARLRGAELALAMGDVDIALEWAEAASAGDASARAALVLGRASLARGDLVSAEAALARARDLAGSGPVHCEALVELGEVRYSRGDLAGAEGFARDALAAAQAPKLRLGARNLFGKLLLSRAEWNAADAHFAADACEAAFAGERVCELRARVNRAIALISRGSPDEARPMLLDVLRDAEARGERRAVGFALSNLSVLAIERHDYAEALDLGERAIVVRRRLGDRLGFARDVTNLVELRLRLGLLEQAEQALRFGRLALGPGAPASRLTELGLAAARVHLQRARTLEAEREVRGALRTAAHASDGDKLAECHRLAARIALEDGLVGRARGEVARAAELAQAPFARGEAALLSAMVARAAGEPCAALAAQAVVAAREAGDEELARDAHVLAAEVALGHRAP